MVSEYTRFPPAYIQSRPLPDPTSVLTLDSFLELARFGFASRVVGIDEQIWDKAPRQ